MDLRTQFDHLHDLSRNRPAPEWDERARRLRRLQAMIINNRMLLGRAICRDFGQRPQAETDMAEVFPALQGLRHALRHGRRWMRPERARTSILFRPGTSWLAPCPLGVVGIVSPWNYPLFLTVGPLTSALVAGNRAMVKLSEHAPEFAETFARLIHEHFEPEIIGIVQGDAGVARNFAQLPFDHLIFTGSTAIGHEVMASAARNLTPITLELGGKSPALVAPDARLHHAVARIMTGKLLNAGQTCIAPDYVLLPAKIQQDFIQLSRDWVNRHYPDLEKSPDYTRIINQQHFDRLSGWITTAANAGSQLHPLSNAKPDLQTRLMPPLIVTEVKGPLAEQEIFGPVLPLITYQELDEALAHIRARPRPLAFYPFTDNAATQTKLLGAVVAGGVTINDTLMHVAQADLPFGGVGASGMGAYHGKAGFDRLSHRMPVFRQSKRNMAGLLAPPYGRRFRSLIGWMMRL